MERKPNTNQEAPESPKNQHSNTSPLSRRSFLGQTAAATAGFMIVPRHVLGGSGYKAPSDRLNIASVGIGGMGRADTRNLHELGENIYALCDVDHDYAGPVFETYPNAKVYTDFRKMLDNEPEIDAVVVSTPDNNHAAVAIYAMQNGKHVYVQKPLARTLYETRRLVEVARETGVKTQMGNQGHAMEGTYRIREWIGQGLLGDITRVDTWTDRPRGFWPQGDGLNHPDEIPAVPGTMEWDLWIGPSPWHPYHPAYAPFRWRGWWDFGAGALGDMGAHILDQPFWSLDLGYPETIHASSTPFNDATFPTGSIVHYEFAARGSRPAVELNWYDGGITPPRPDTLEPGKPIGGGGNGMIFYGSKGILTADVYGNNPHLIPESDVEKLGTPEKTLERSPGIYAEWVQAIKEDGETTSNFEYASRLTETMLAGNVAIKFSDRDQKLHYDGEKIEFTNLPDANDWIEQRKEELRPGWKEIIG